MWTECLGLLFRSCLILGAAELWLRFSRRSSPVYRHRILAAAFFFLLVWPLLSAVVPELDFTLARHETVFGSVAVRQTAKFGSNRVAPHVAVLWSVCIWCGGLAIVLGRVALGYLRVLRSVRSAKPLQDRSWNETLSRICVELKVRNRPTLLVHPSHSAPFTFGVIRPCIALPADCSGWEPIRKRTVLLHELTHIVRRDLSWQLLANAATALWWFQPLCWWSRRHLRRESERACDIAVLTSGIRPSEYAAELLAISRCCSTAESFSSFALPMARETELEERVRAILQPTAGFVGRFSWTPFFVLFVLTLTASAVTLSSGQVSSPGGRSMKRTLMSSLLASAGLSAATIGGSVYDSTGIAVPNAHVSLYNPDTSQTQEATTNRDGKFSFESLGAGSYILRLEKPGFRAQLREFNVKTESEVLRGLVLNAAADSTAAQAGRETGDSSDSDKLLRVRGTVAQANLLKKVQPVYPMPAKLAHVQGTVTLEATISKEGIPEDLRVLSSPSDDLTQSALEAVRQWRYRPTLLNGQPEAIVTEVLINYTLSE